MLNFRKESFYVRYMHGSHEKHRMWRIQNVGMNGHACKFENHFEWQTKQNSEKIKRNMLNLREESFYAGFLDWHELSCMQFWTHFEMNQRNIWTH